MIKRAFVLALVFTLVVPMVVMASTRFEYTIGTVHLQQMIGSGYKQGQSFLSESVHTISSVKVLIYKANNPSLLTLSLYLADGDHYPTGGVLASGTLAGAGVTTDTAGAWYEITMSPEYPLTDATQYVLVGTAPDDGTNRFYWKQNLNEYANGISVYYSTIWKQNAALDLIFENWGQVPAKPQPPTDISFSEFSLESVSINWTKDGDADSTYIRGMRGGVYPSAVTDGLLVYDDVGESCNVTGLSLDLSTYSFSFWSENEQGYSENFTSAGVGGDIVEMDVALVLPTGFYVLLAGLFLVFISFFLKSPLIYLAVIPCMVGVLLEPAFKDLWFQSGCALVIIWSALSFFTKLTEGGTG